MKKLSPWRATRRNRKPRAAARLDQQTSSPSIDSSPLGLANGSVSLAFAKTDIRYWQQQLIVRAYGNFARPRPFREFSAKIEHAGGCRFFPLDTGSETRAAGRALQIYRTILAKGWRGAFRRHPREFILALSWAENPMIFTYTTLYTETQAFQSVQSSRRRRPNGSPKVAVAIIEAEDGCRWALNKWICSLPEYFCCAAYPTVKEALPALKHRAMDLLLFDLQLTDVLTGECFKSLQSPGSHVPTLGYRIYDTSDEMFYSQPGVSEGYYFRRRPPENLLEPIRGAWRCDPPTPAEWVVRIHDYVQKQFLHPRLREEAEDSSALTSRENDILSYLRKGSPDKDIARALNISAWTVHTHLKKIYRKLDVHSRTEAVFNYLQK